MKDKAKKEAVVTAVFGKDAENLGATFTSFGQRTDAELHAFVLGDNLPARREEGIYYHLKKPTGDLGPTFRELCFRRWEFIDDLDADRVLLVDGADVLCLQDLPRIEDLLRSAWVGACVEHRGSSRLILGQGYTSNYLNAGVTLWDIPRTRDLRKMIIDRGRGTFRTTYVDDQLCFNEVVQTLYYDKLVILPCQYNYQAFVRHRKRGWPSLESVDGVVLYHCRTCVDSVSQMSHAVSPKARLPELGKIPLPANKAQEILRRLVYRCRRKLF